MIRHLIAATLACIAVPVVADAPIGSDAPELAARRSLAVGTRSMTLTFADRPDVLAPDGKGGFAHRDRMLPIEIWYPADARGAQHTRYTMPRPRVGGADPALPATIAFDGSAARDALPAAGRFPLLVLSHGFGNRAVMFSELAENIASKGYVVVAIEHGDIDPATAASPLAAFLVTLVNRAADQRFVIDEIARRVRAANGTVFAHIDADKVALLGYSMGGFGALATAGAGYDPASPLFKQVPAGLLDAAREGSATAPANLRALIAIAPWGGASATRMWTPAALAAITIPTLMIDGDRDDIVDYAGGVHWLFDAMRASDRHLLVYREARHNIAMNATPPALAGDFRYRERFDEPVWRKDRILGINAHMLTAFLDWRLKGIAARASYLNVPTPVADDGAWPLAPGAEAASRYAGATEPQHWPGFQRRWALGLELTHRASGQ